MRHFHQDQTCQRWDKDNIGMSWLLMSTSCHLHDLHVFIRLPIYIQIIEERSQSQRVCHMSGLITRLILIFSPSEASASELTLHESNGAFSGTLMQNLPIKATRSMCAFPGEANVSLPLHLWILRQCEDAWESSAETVLWWNTALKAGSGPRWWKSEADFRLQQIKVCRLTLVTKKTTCRLNSLSTCLLSSSFM